MIISVDSERERFQGKNRYTKRRSKCEVAGPLLSGGDKSEIASDNGLAASEATVLMQQIEPVKSSRASKVYIVEDHPVFRQGLAQLIDEQPDLKVCGQAADAETALPAIKRLLPDAVLVDITLPGKSGLALIRELGRLPQIKILVVSMHDEALYANRVLRAGAHGYVMKQEDPQEIVDALRDVLAGGIYLSEAVLESIGSATRKRAKISKRPLENLTDMELEMLEALGRGKSRKAMAKEFRLSERTITAWSGKIRKKLGLRSSGALMRYAVCWVETGSSGRRAGNGVMD